MYLNKKTVWFFEFVKTHNNADRVVWCLTLISGFLKKVISHLPDSKQNRKVISYALQVSFKSVSSSATAAITHCTNLHWNNRLLFLLTVHSSWVIHWLCCFLLLSTCRLNKDGYLFALEESVLGITSHDENMAAWLLVVGHVTVLAGTRWALNEGAIETWLLD